MSLHCFSVCVLAVGVLTTPAAGQSASPPPAGIPKRSVIHPIEHKLAADVPGTGCIRPQKEVKLRPQVDAATAKQPVRDFSSPDSGAIVNLVLKDWFTNPRHRKEALSLLNDAPSDPPGAPLYPLRHVVIDVRAAPKGYRPAIPGIPTIVLNRFNRTLEPGELGIWIRRFEPHPDGTSVVEFTEDNYGYTGDVARYRVLKTPAKYRVEFISSNLGE